jgi:hypothetical protein
MPHTLTALFSHANAPVACGLCPLISDGRLAYHLSVIVNVFPVMPVILRGRGQIITSDVWCMTSECGILNVFPVIPVVEGEQP